MLTHDKKKKVGTHKETQKISSNSTKD